MQGTHEKGTLIASFQEQSTAIVGIAIRSRWVQLLICGKWSRCKRTTSCFGSLNEGLPFFFRPVLVCFCKWSITVFQSIHVVFCFRSNASTESLLAASADGSVCIWEPRNYKVTFCLFDGIAIFVCALVVGHVCLAQNQVEHPSKIGHFMWNGLAFKFISVLGLRRLLSAMFFRNWCIRSL